MTGKADRYRHKAGTFKTETLKEPIGNALRCGMHAGQHIVGQLQIQLFDTACQILWGRCANRAGFLGGCATDDDFGIPIMAMHSLSAKEVAINEMCCIKQFSMGHGGFQE